MQNHEDTIETPLMAKPLVKSVRRGRPECHGLKDGIQALPDATFIRFSRYFLQTYGIILHFFAQYTL